MMIATNDRKPKCRRNPSKSRLSWPAADDHSRTCLKIPQISRAGADLIYLLAIATPN